MEIAATKLSKLKLAEIGKLKEGKNTRNKLILRQNRHRDFGTLNLSNKFLYMILLSGV
jgi:hypothetical protein